MTVKHVVVSEENETTQFLAWLGDIPEQLNGGGGGSSAITRNINHRG